MYNSTTPALSKECSNKSYQLVTFNFIPIQSPINLFFRKGFSCFKERAMVKK